MSLPGKAGAELSEPTGRYVVVLADSVHGDEKAMTAALRSVGAANVSSASDFTDNAVDMEQASDADALLLPKLGVAVVPGDPDQLASLIATASDDDRIEAVEPELILHALAQPGSVTAEYLLGFRDAAQDLYTHANGGTNGATSTAVEIAAQFVDTPAFTWGLQATKVSTSHRTGQGVAVAMLDTGFDLRHPDFVGRRITSQSFVPNQPVQDGHGHGTHVTGPSSGPQHPPGGHRRYGIAYQDNIFIGKVLSDQGSGSDRQILAGIEWAITNGCRIISMSLGADVRPVNQAYEKVGQRALAAGTLIIAAAGNNADRAHGNVGFVGVPANSPSIMAVAAVDADLQIANFSPRSNPVAGGQIDIAGPGVMVDSSWSTTSLRAPDRYKIISGTSMATPHVAGVVALMQHARVQNGKALLTPAQVLLHLKAKVMPPAAQCGKGLLDARASVQAAIAAP